MLKTVTMKFGGTSVGSAEAIQNVVSIVQHTLGNDAEHVVLVCSAMSGVTNLLQKGVSLAEANKLDAVEEVKQELVDKHHDAAYSLLQLANAKAVMRQIEPLIEEYWNHCESIAVLGEATPRAYDYTMALGERMSVRLVAAVFTENGLDSEFIEASSLIVTDERFRDAAPKMEPTRENIQKIVKPMLEQGIVPVVTGFIGATEKGVITTLGRGGSDYSAAIIAAGLDSDELWIWTDVDGVMSTDPRVVAEARSIDTLSYREISEMAYFGAKVVHPKTMRPLREDGTPIRVLNTFNPEHKGTLIVPDSQADSRPLKAVTAIRNVSMITVEGRGIQGIPGVAGRTFTAVARTDTSIMMISQSSSEQSIFFVVPQEQSVEVVAALEEEFQLETRRGDIDRIQAQNDFCIVTVVGAGMRDTPGVSALVFKATGDAGVNVVASAHGSSDCSISLAVAESQLDLALWAIHSEAIMVGGAKIGVE